jgi:FemAB-related protein (PEP-CTERM system-associated)
VERGCGQRAHYLVAEDGSGAIAGLLPLSHIESRLFGSALVSTGFGVGGGILARDEAIAGSLADAAWALALSLDCPTVELRGGRLPAEWQHKQGIYFNFARDLPSGEEAILKSIPRRQRAEVRRALGFGLDVSIGSDARHRRAHYALYAESVRNLGTPVFPRALFEAMLDEYGEDADIAIASKDGRPLYSVLNFYFDDTIYLYWGGGSPESRKWRATERTYYELMLHASRRGCTRFDFGRSKDGTGAFAFKKHWGFEPEPMIHAIRTADGAAPREINPLDPRYRFKIEAWKRLPLWLANRLGPPIARGLG